MTNFQHLIMTRFNVPSWPHHRVPDAAWHAHRFELFEQFCWPSVRGQSEQDFRWLVFFAEATPAPFRQRALALADEWDGFRPIFLVENSPNAINAAIAKQLDDTEWLLSTNLDNDDALARSFVATLHTLAQQHGPSFLDLPSGYRLMRQQHKLFACDIHGNPFISLLEIRREAHAPETILKALPHSTIRERYADHVVACKTPPLWLQVVHERNLGATGRWGRSRVPLNQLAVFEHEWHAVHTVQEAAWHLKLDRARGAAERRILDAIPRQVRRRLLTRMGY